VGTEQLTAAQVLAHRILSSGLARDADPLERLPLGLQDTSGWARLVLLNRAPDDQVDALLDAVTAADPADRDAPLALGWTLRGSPHLHRRNDFRRIAAALWPADAQDAAVRLVGSGRGLLTDGADPLDALREVATAARRLIRAPMTKGEASSLVTAAVSAGCSAHCRGCGVVHVREQLFRCAMLPAGIGAVPDTKPIVLAPLRPSVRTPRRQDAAGVVDDWLRLFGCGSAADLGEFLGTSAAGVAVAGAVPARVDGRSVIATTESLAAMRAADADRAVSLTRFLGPGDPVLSARDHQVLVPDAGHRTQVWKMIGSPGVVLAGGAAIGTWRARTSGTTLTLTADLWQRAGAALRTVLDQEAERVRIARGARTVRLAIG
jgi:hypothetical protein